MAIGDAAAAAGMNVVPAAADARKGYEEINRTRDYLAAQGKASVPISRVTGNLPVTRVTGVVPTSKGGLGRPNIYEGPTWTTAATGTPRLTAVATNGEVRPVSGPLHESLIPGVVNAEPNSIVRRDAAGRVTVQSPTLGAHAASKAYVDQAVSAIPTPTAAADTVTAAAYERTVSGGGYYSMWMDSNRRIGRNTSSRRYKEDIAPADLDPAAVLALQPVTYHRTSSPPGEYELGLIAEDVAAAGLPGLVVMYDDQIDGVRYDLLGVALLPVVQALAADVAALTARIETLEADRAAGQ